MPRWAIGSPGAAVYPGFVGTTVKVVAVDVPAVVFAVTVTART